MYGSEGVPAHQNPGTLFGELAQSLRDFEDDPRHGGVVSGGFAWSDSVLG